MPKIYKLNKANKSKTMKTNNITKKTLKRNCAILLKNHLNLKNL